MLYLFIFGPAVEERFGTGALPVFLLCSGNRGGLATVAMAPQSPVPVIGASGAIAGVLGAYFVLYPRGRIRPSCRCFSLAGSKSRRFST